MSSKIGDDGFVHLGCPVGSEAFVANHIAQKIEQLRNVIDKIHILQDSHMEYVLLRSCFSLPKMNYLMRTSTPLVSSQFYWNRFDELMREALTRILGANLSDDNWKQASLPVSMSGLGIRLATNHVAAAFIGSISDSESLIGQIMRGATFDLDLQIPLQIYSEKVGEEETLSYDQIHGRQKQLSYRVDCFNQGCHIFF